MPNGLKPVGISLLHFFTFSSIFGAREILADQPCGPPRSAV
jgi:hypothetical protein